MNLCQTKLGRAEKLIIGLGNEKQSWDEKGQQRKQSTKTLVGDAILCATFVSYKGVFPTAFREKAKKQMIKILVKTQVDYDAQFNFQEKLENPITVGKWISQQKLPNDTFSIENAVIMGNSNLWSICIDPQSQANTWIKEKEKENKIIILNPQQPVNLILNKFENSLQLGYPILLENVKEEIAPPQIESVVYRQFVKKATGLIIQLGDKLIECDLKYFKLYMTCKLSNPTFPPELSSRVTLVNFIVTEEGLNDQVLNILVKLEEPEMDKLRVQNVQELFECKVNMEQCENKILELITNSKGSELLDDETLIEALRLSKTETENILEKIGKLDQFQRQFMHTRNSYKGVSIFTSSIFFVFMDLCIIDHMYQFSLEWFIDLFEKSIRRAPQTTPAERSGNIIATFLTQIYANGCRTLKEPDKILLSFQICLKIMMIKKKVSQKEIRFLTVGGYSAVPKYPNPDATWLTSKNWANLIELCDQLPAIFGDTFLKDFTQHIALFKKVFKHEQVAQIISQAPLSQQLVSAQTMEQIKRRSEDDSGEHSDTHTESASRKDSRQLAETAPTKGLGPGAGPGSEPSSGPSLPLDWNERLSSFQKLMLVRLLAPNQVTNAISNLIQQEIGAQFTKSQYFDIEEVYQDSKCSTPIIYILSSGIDPLDYIMQFAEKHNMKFKFKIISLGQGQQAKAEKAVDLGIQTGQWIVLQNCHLAPSFMPILERIFENFSDRANTQKDFRLWLTTNSTTLFPISILQKGIKIRSDPPSGIKNLMMRSYNLMEADALYGEMHNKFPLIWQRCVYALTFFHAVVQERKKFGPIGWNHPYEFAQADLVISLKQIAQLICQHYDIKESMWEYIRYLIGETNYGGRVSDEHDRYLLNVILNQFTNSTIFEQECNMVGAHYPTPRIVQQEENFILEQKKAIESFPQVDQATAFKMNDNAEIIGDIFRTNSL